MTKKTQKGTVKLKGGFTGYRVTLIVNGKPVQKIVTIPGK